MPYVSDFSYGDYNYNMKRKYYLIALLTILITLCSTIFLFGCNEKEDNIETFNITYSTNYGGRIDGEANQTVKKGDCGNEVTAIAWEEGYYFEKWSDGVEEATRKEENVTENKRIEAIFKIMEFTVEYQSGDGGYVKGGTIIRGIQYGADLNEIVEAIPNEGYEFDVWSDGVTTATRQEKNITSNKQIFAYFKLKHIQVTYAAESNGKIEGAAEQSVIYGRQTEWVTAVPDEGYKFIGWSDGYKTETRRDYYCTKDIQITAYFEIIKRTFKLNYNMVTKDAVEEVELTYFETDKVTLPVPEKDKFTFCGWYQDKLQVSDENGIIIAGDKVFENSLNKLHAKWQAHETFTYKILMIYITDVQATLPTKTGNKVEVNYHITDLERQIYHNITIKLEEILEDMLDGLVDFVVDEYFTTQPIGAESFVQAWNGTSFDVSLHIWDIPEISLEMRKQYQSVIATLNFNQDTSLFFSGGGAATEKYGYVFFDPQIRGLLGIVGNKLEDLMDLNNSYWKNIIGAYIHEFVHTIEQRKGYFEFHTAISKPFLGDNIWWALDELEKYKLYIIKEIYDDNEKVVIPYEFWEEDLKNPYEERF